MHFETTNTPMRKDTGACRNLQYIIRHLLLWVASRKHVGEVHGGKTFDIAMVEVNISPDLLVFKWFREYFSKIALWTATKKLFDINNISMTIKNSLLLKKI